MKNIGKILLTLILFIGLVALVGCNKEEDSNESKKEVKKDFDFSNYNKETETYSLKTTDGKGEATFKFAKDLGYENANVNAAYRVQLKHPKNKTTIEVQFFHTNIGSKTITKTKDDYSSSKYFGFEEFKIGEYEGWEVYQTIGKIVKYEGTLYLTKVDEKNQVYAVHISITPSSLGEGGTINTEEFISSTDFQYLLNSFTLITN